MQEHLSELSRRYREEMLRMYNQKPAAPETEAPPVPSAPEESVPAPDMQEAEPIPPDENPAFTGEDGDYQDRIEAAPEEVYEEPELPDYIRNGTPPVIEPQAADELRDLTGEGRIRVAARTGDSAFPVENAVVTIAVRRNGTQYPAYYLVTDESGETPVVSLPAPPASLSQQPGNAQPFTVADIRIFANGYFRAEMKNVPVFAGVTSLQTFQLIPLPILMHEDMETLSAESESPDL